MVKFATKETPSSHCKYSSKSSLKDLWPLTRVPICCKKGNSRILQPLNSASELTVISRNQKYHWELRGAYIGQRIDGVLHQFQITPGLWTHLAAIPQFLNV